MNNWKTIEVPFRMKDLAKDKSGYPIPFSIRRDSKGNAYFKEHDVKRLAECIINKQCSICGQALDSEIWLLAGAKVAFHPHGGYIDPPLHRECASYALQVCPYLAHPSFLKRSSNEVNDSNHVKMLLGKPVVFALVKTFGYKLHFTENGTIIMMPIRPFIDIEFWREGQQISESQAKALLND